TNNLRSALNYTMRHFIEVRLKSVLSRSEYKKIRRDHDFPWSDSRAGFDKKAVVGYVRSHSKPINDSSFAMT
ncbi:MAG: hypothetical protein OEW09_07820, partial [Anaerolineae bacterium]|nr:hypothetical protein [Anaerolineae bacterium]